MTPDELDAIEADYLADPLVPVDVDSLIAALREAWAEVERLRVKHTEMNRRLTKAEAHVETTIEDCRRQGDMLDALELLRSGVYRLAQIDGEVERLQTREEWEDNEAIRAAERERIAREIEALASVEHEGGAGVTTGWGRGYVDGLDRAARIARGEA